MATLDSVASVSITTSGLTPAVPNFGVPLVLAFHTRFAELIRTYTDLASMEADGFVAADAAHTAAAALLAQSPTVEKFKVGRRTHASVHTLAFRPDPKNATAYGITVNGVHVSFTSDSTATAAEIIAGLVTLINGAVAAVTASSINSNADLQIVHNTSGQRMVVLLDSPSLWLRATDNSTDAGIAADLTAIEAVDNDWYAVLLTDGSKDEIVAAAGHVESNGKVLFATTIDRGGSTATDVLDPSVTTDVLSALKTANKDRTIPFFSFQQGDFLHAAAAGTVLTLDPGSYTMKFKQPSGVSSYTLTPTAQQAVDAKNGNWFEPIAGVGILGEGKTSKGSFMDFVIFLDWLSSTIQTDLFALQASLLKLGYDDAGIAKAASTLRGSLAKGEQVNALDPAFTKVTSPKVGSISPSVRATRVLNKLTFACRYDGAIHKVNVSGVVTF